MGVKYNMEFITDFLLPVGVTLVVGIITITMILDILG